MNRIIIKETVSIAHCPVSEPGPMDAPSTSTEALEIFSQQILDMAKQHGDQIVADSVRLVVPDGRPGSMGWDELLDYLIDRLSPQGASDLETALSEEELLDEQAGAVALGALGRGALKWGGKAVGKIKNLFKRNPKKTVAAGAAGTAGVAARSGLGGGLIGGGLGAGAGTLAGTALGSMIDKDVNIANVSTSDRLGVEIARGGAPWIENLIGQTNDLLKQMIALLGQSQPALSQGLSDLDTSIDDLISVETGESTSAIQTRQGLSGGHTARPRRGARPAKEKASKKSKDKEEKTQSE